MKIIATQGPKRWLVREGSGRDAVGIVVSFEDRPEGDTWKFPLDSVLSRGYWVEAGEIEPDLRDRILALAERA